MARTRIILIAIISSITLGLPTLSAKNTEWVDDGLALVRLIEKQGLIAKTQDWEEIENRAASATGEEKLRILNNLVVNAVTSGELDKFNRHMTTYRAEVAAQNIERHRRSIKLIEAYAAGATNGDYEEAANTISALIENEALDRGQLAQAYTLLIYA